MAVVEKSDTEPLGDVLYRFIRRAIFLEIATIIRDEFGAGDWSAVNFDGLADELIHRSQISPPFSIKDFEDPNG